MFEFSSPIIFFIVIAIVCFIVEMFTLSFYAIFISIGCLFISLFLYLDYSFFTALCLGGVLAIIGLILFQKYFQKKAMPQISANPLQNLIGQKGNLLEAIGGLDNQGTVILDGTAWRAAAPTPIAKDSQVLVVDIYSLDTLTVLVKQISGDN